MVFSSPIFLFLFLPVVLALYGICPRPLKNSLLLLASLVFYGWGEPVFVLLMLASIVGNYLFGLWLGYASGSDRRNVLALAVVMNLGLLGYYKYAGFLVENVNAILGWQGRPPFHVPDIVLPIGISFFTFQAMSYVIDAYRGDVRIEKNPINVAVYVSMFPQLIAGPIVRFSTIAQELHERHVDLDTFASGVRRFIIGLGKKVLIANSVAVAADSIFAAPSADMSLATAWVGIVCYTLQIYFDFSGYSDMAIGLGRMLGFHFLENFQYPYVSRSITEFWRRWHISLSTWFRDYLYIPLGGNRGAPWRVFLNLLIVFTLCGLWHGAQWTFLIWGLFHGAFLILERIALGGPLARAPAALKHLYTLLVVMLGWVFFRAATFGDALVYLRAASGLNGAGLGLDQVSLHIDAVILLAIVAGMAGSIPWLPKYRALLERWLQRPERRPLTQGVYALHEFGGVVVLMLIFGVCVISLSAQTYNPFIYFRF